VLLTPSCRGWERALRRRPDLVVEVVSDDSVGRGRQTKRAEYAAQES